MYQCGKSMKNVCIRRFDMSIKCLSAGTVFFSCCLSNSTFFDVNVCYISPTPLHGVLIFKVKFQKKKKIDFLIIENVKKIFFFLMKTSKLFHNNLLLRPCFIYIAFFVHNIHDSLSSYYTIL